MNKTRIFVSSTYFDLAQVRDNLFSTITDIGHTPIMSEFSSFPVLPDLSNVENCRRNVRENTDILVLIVGGRRGSLDPVSNRPITNIEYEAAVSIGLDIFVFVAENVLTLLPTWEKNPTADFLPHVDSPDVFSFVKKIRDSQRWTYSFRKSNDIAEILKAQLSTYLKYLLDRKNAKTLDPLPEFRLESARARSLCLDRPRFWEHLLTAELLRTKLMATERKLDHLEKGLLIRRNRTMDFPEALRWIQDKLDDLKSIVDAAVITFEQEVPRSWGPPGVSGDPKEIMEAVEKVAYCCDALAEWEADARSVHPPNILDPVWDALKGSARDIFNQLAPIAERLEAGITSATAHKGPDPLVIPIEFKLAFPRAERISHEIRRIKNDIFQ